MHGTLEKLCIDVLMIYILITTMSSRQLAVGLQLQNTTWKISETSPLGTVVGAVEVTPSLTNLTCSLSASIKIQEYFTLGSRTCVVTLKKSLLYDPDKLTIYHIGVDVSGYDTTSQSSSVILEVSVNRDLYSPVITNLPATVGINETSVTGTFVFKVDAKDDDQNSKVVCEIAPSYPASIYFQINSTSCEVVLCNSVLQDSQTSYQVPIQVYDINWADNKVTKNLVVNVNRNLYRPIFSGSSTANINTSFPSGETILLLTATDADGDRLTFSKVNSNDSSGNFFVDSTTGRIILIKPLTGSGTYTFDVEATDNRNPAKNSTQTVQIYVTNVSSPPYFVNAPYSATININSVVNTEVPTSVRADKQYLVGSIKYRLAGGVPADVVNFFSIDANSGRVTLKQRLDDNVLMKNRYGVVLFIEANDDRVPAEVISTTCSVNFQRNLSPPVFTLSNYFATMEDYSPTGYSVITVGATDNDPLAPENMVLYKLDPSRGQADYFSINTFTGLITVSKRVSSDPANLSSYTLYVVAQDPSLEPKTSIATVRVTVNRNIAPNFQGRALSAQIYDTVEIMSPFLTASATDTDSMLRPDSDNGKLDFSIINIDNTTDVRKIFTVDSKGQISAVRSLQNLPNSTYIFHVIVSDRGSPPLSAVATVTVTILPSPALALTASSGLLNMPETNPTPSVIAVVTATNVAGRGVIIYELISDGFAKQAFNVNTTTGVITQLLPFTADTLKSLSYLLTVRAYSQIDPTTQAYKTIRVIVDRNPTSPQFTRQSFTYDIPESQVLGNVFGNITATDSDNGTAGELTYTISRVFNNPLSSYTFFYLNPYTGDLSVSRSLLDDRNTKVYTFPVRVTDNGVPQLSATATCTVNILRNTNAPVFVPKNTYHLEIPEDYSVGRTLLDLNATDADDHNVSYSIERSDINTLYFNIDNSTGIISLAASLLRIYNSQFNLTVLASDDQQPPGVAEAYVTIDVVRNPNAPQFVSKVYEKNISEYQAVTDSFLKLEATDLDSPSSDSGRVTYYIVNQTVISPTPTAGFKKDFFTIGFSNGHMYLSRPVTTLESADAYHIYIRAQDGSITPKYDTTLVKINIVRDLYRPEFSATNFSALISETQDINSEILNVAAVDKDVDVELNKQTPNSLVVYELRDFQESNKQSRFFGVTETGIIYKKQATTGNTGSETFSFQVVASDKNWQKNMFSVANVSITVSYVGSVNGELGFIQPIYLLNIKENAAVSNTSSILILDIENQDNYQVTCTIVGGSDTFTVKSVNNEKNCGLFLISSLDRESRDRYDLTVSVQSKALTETGRRKRQSMCRYNTWTQSRVVISVGDINDNAPQWVHVTYPLNTVPPPDGTRGVFITAVDHSAPTETVAIHLKATDSDLGLNGEVRYDLDAPASAPQPFRIDEVSGALLTKEIPSEDRASKVLPYQMTAVAYDLSGEQFKSAKAKCYINLIRDINRFVMTVTDRDYSQVIAFKENYRLALQNATNFVIIIERIEAKRDSQNGGMDLKATDIVFVAAATKEPYQLISNNDTNSASLLTSGQALAKVRDAFHGSLSTSVAVVPLAYSRDLAVRNVLTKSYIWWMDDPWAALIALAAIISLLTVVGIIVLEFTYARYLNYITLHRKNLDYSNTGPESETQSVHMFIPVEEADTEYKEIEMKLSPSQLEATTLYPTVPSKRKSLPTRMNPRTIPDITVSAVQ